MNLLTYVDLKKIRKQFFLEDSNKSQMSKIKDLHNRDGKAKRSKSMHEKSETLNNTRSVSTRFPNLKNLRKLSLSKLLGAEKPGETELDSFSIANQSMFKENTSGILKIFVESLSLGSNYKSIMITSKTSSKNVLRLVLERYNIPTSTVNRYVLCEVTGKVTTYNNNQLTRAKSFDGKQFSTSCK